MKIPFPLSLLFPKKKNTAAIMATFTSAITELESVAQAEMDAATVASDKAEEIYDKALSRADNQRAAAEKLYIQTLALIDTQEEKAMGKVEKVDAEWEAHVKERDAALAAANQLRNAFGISEGS